MTRIIARWVGSEPCDSDRSQIIFMLTQIRARWLRSEPCDSDRSPMTRIRARCAPGRHICSAFASTVFGRGQDRQQSYPSQGCGPCKRPAGAMERSNHVPRSHHGPETSISQARGRDTCVMGTATWLSSSPQRARALTAAQRGAGAGGAGLQAPPRAGADESAADPGPAPRPISALARCNLHREICDNLETTVTYQFSAAMFWAPRTQNLRQTLHD